jgi:hypothetical protein
MMRALSLAEAVEDFDHLANRLLVVSRKLDGRTRRLTHSEMPLTLALFGHLRGGCATSGL